MAFQKILFSMTYSETTPESSEDGDFSDSGFVWGEGGGEHCSFHQLVDYVEYYGFTYWSSSDQTGWLSTGFSITDFISLTERETNLHPQNARSLRYLKKAFDYVNPKVRQ